MEGIVEFYPRTQLPAAHLHSRYRVAKSAAACTRRYTNFQIVLAASFEKPLRFGEGDYAVAIFPSLGLTACCFALDISVIYRHPSSSNRSFFTSHDYTIARARRYVTQSEGELAATASRSYPFTNVTQCWAARTNKRAPELGN